MRNLVTLKVLSVCLVALAAAACRDRVGNNLSADLTDPPPANGAVPAPEENSAANAADTANAAAATNTAAAVANTSRASGAYQAFGTEPYWSVTIRGGRMRYNPADGAAVSEPLPARTPIANGYRYAGRRMTVEVIHRTCYEAGEESYPDEVLVTVGGRILNGCGGGRGERG